MEIIPLSLLFLILVEDGAGEWKRTQVNKESSTVLLDGSKNWEETERSDAKAMRMGQGEDFAVAEAFASMESPRADVPGFLGKRGRSR